MEKKGNKTNGNSSTRLLDRKTRRAGPPLRIVPTLTAAPTDPASSSSISQRDFRPVPHVKRSSSSPIPSGLVRSSPRRRRREGGCRPGREGMGLRKRRRCLKGWNCRRRRGGTIEHPSNPRRRRGDLGSLAHLARGKESVVGEGAHPTVPGLSTVGRLLRRRRWRRSELMERERGRWKRDPGGSELICDGLIDSSGDVERYGRRESSERLSCRLLDDGWRWSGSGEGRTGGRVLRSSVADARSRRERSRARRGRSGKRRRKSGLRGERKQWFGSSLGGCGGGGGKRRLMSRLSSRCREGEFGGRDRRRSRISVPPVRRR
ncbi:hypothetical protein BDY24DRAFT_259787 [Mrakia frigida]|uniref:uncharacterized protein n=1 Tax=Mrakia frigida TaxID=29902 RepID=UPI003FCC1ECB